MRERVIEYIPKFVYAKSQTGLESIKDAFDVATEGVLRRLKEQEEGKFKKWWWGENFGVKFIEVKELYLLR